MGLDTQCMRARREGEAHQLVGFRDGSRKGHCLNLKGVRFRGLSILVLASQGMLHRLARCSTRVVHVLGQRGVPPPCLFRRSLSVQAAHPDNNTTKKHHEDWLSEIGQGELVCYANILVSLGINRARDLQYVDAKDLVHAGVPLVSARRLIAASARPAQEVSMMMRPQATLNGWSTLATCRRYSR
jgi:hypothetical protein